MGLYWTGTGFEERMNLMPPSPADSATPQSQQAAVFQRACDFPESSKNGLPGTQDRALQKMSQDIGKRVEGRKQNDDANMFAGRVSYDPDLGSWVRAHEIPASPPIPNSTRGSGSSASLAVNANEQREKSPARGNGFPFRWTSRFRVGPEQRRVLVTPPPEKPSERQLQSLAVSEEAPAAPPLDVLGSEVQILANQGVSFSTASSRADTREILNPEIEPRVEENTAVPTVLLAVDQVGTIPEPEPPAAHNAAAAPALIPAISQETTAADAAVEPGCQLTLVPAAASVRDEKSEECQWQSAVEQGEDVILPACSAADTHPVTHAPDKSRWFVLNNILGRAAEQRAPAPKVENGVPVLQVFSLAGGAGKTTLVATLGRALSAQGERVLLVEAKPLGSLQYFFGACDFRPGAIRTFRAPDSKSNAPIRLASVASESLLPESAKQGSLATDIQRWSQGSCRAIVDIGTGPPAAVRALSRLSTVVLVPLIPDLSSVVSANTMDLIFRRHAEDSVGSPEVFYVLNQFDPSRPLHIDIRNSLRERLGERLLPFTLERATEVSEAMAEGMTVMDYAPSSEASANFTSLANWLQDVQKAPTTSRHGRWSET